MDEAFANVVTVRPLWFVNGRFAVGTENTLKHGFLRIRRDAISTFWFWQTKRKYSDGSALDLARLAVEPVCLSAGYADVTRRSHYASPCFWNVSSMF